MYEVIAQYFHTAKQTDVVRLDGFDEKLTRREEIVETVAALQEEQRKIEQEVKVCIGSSQHAASGRYRVTWGNVDSVKLDTKRIREEQPEIYAAYGRTSHYRRFEVRAA